MPPSLMCENAPELFQEILKYVLSILGVKNYSVILNELSVKTTCYVDSEAGNNAFVQQLETMHCCSGERCDHRAS